MGFEQSAISSIKNNRSLQRSNSKFKNTPTFTSNCYTPIKIDASLQKRLKKAAMTKRKKVVLEITLLFGIILIILFYLS